MKLTVYDDASAFEQLQPEWNYLLERSAANTIFATWEWQFHWWKAYQPGTLWIVTCRDDVGRLIAIAPWFIGSDDGERVVCGIGCVDVTDYVDIIIDRDCTEAVMNCLAEFLVTYQSAFDRIALCNIPEYSTTYTQFPEYLKRRGFDTSLEQLEVCPVIQLPGDWEEYVASLGKKDRHELRRKLRRADGYAGDVRCYTVDDTYDLDEQLRQFLNLMAASDPKKASFLQNEKNLTFFQSIMPVLFERGWLQLVFLTIDGDYAAAYLNLDYGDRVSVYNSGLLRGVHDHLSPGIVLLGHTIRTAILNGYRIFDFLRGSEPYKYDMGGRDTGVFKLSAKRVA